MQHGKSGATLRLGSGLEAMSLRARGRHRFGIEARPNDIILTRRNGHWFVSVTLRVPEEICARQRTGDARRGVDFGITDRATFNDGRTIANPRWVHARKKSEQRVGGAHRRHRDATHDWDGRGGETQTSATVTWQVQVCDLRKPRDNAMR